MVSFPYSAAPVISTLSLHDALPISREWSSSVLGRFPETATDSWIDAAAWDACVQLAAGPFRANANGQRDRKSTRLNSSHTVNSYAVFRLKKKKRSRRPIRNGERIRL